MNEARGNTTVLKGTCVWFNAGKGYGFVRDEATGQEHFVHWTALRGMKGFKEIQKDQAVSFEIEQGPNGKPQATNVFVLEEEANRSTTVR